MALIDKLTALADAIRSKTGKTEKLTLDQMVEEINTLRQAPMYTVRFLNGDVVLQTSQVREGETPIFAGENPTPEPDFAFVGWLPEIAPVTGDVDYVAQFKSTKSVTRAIIDKSINFPYSNDTITSVGERAFYMCTLLPSADIPNATSIGVSAFNNCRGLTSVSLPNATSIGGSAFNNCRGLTSVSLPAVPPTLSDVNAFGSIPSNCVFHIPAGSLSAYQSATNWSTLTEQYTFTEDA